MDGRCASMEASERESEGDARTALGNGGERGARRLKHNRRASLFDARLGEERAEEGKKGGDLSRARDPQT